MRSGDGNRIQVKRVLVKGRKRRRQLDEPVSAEIGCCRDAGFETRASGEESFGEIHLGYFQFSLRLIYKSDVPFPIPRDNDDDDSNDDNDWPRSSRFPKPPDKRRWDKGQNGSGEKEKEPSQRKEKKRRRRTQYEKFHLVVKEHLLTYCLLSVTSQSEASNPRPSSLSAVA